ncbi:MAG: hypothetical protein ACPIOQ_75865 [Promethearchaeia archaeon]
MLRAATVPEAEAVIPHRQLPPAPRRIAWAVLVPAPCGGGLRLRPESGTIPGISGALGGGRIRIGDGGASSSGSTSPAFG